MFRRLVESISKQIVPNLGIEVNIISECDNGVSTIGDKRQRLLERAKGDYLSFVDDDDRVDHIYISRIRDALVGSPDCVGIQGIITVDGGHPQLFEHSIRHRSWFTNDGVHYRCPNHLNPVRRELALRAGFGSISFGEDHEYSKRLMPLIKTENFIDGPIYFYDYVSRKK